MSIEKRQYPRIDVPAGAQQARLRVAGEDHSYPIAIKNVSVRGLMGLSDMHCEPGTIVEIELPGVGWIEGAIAWLQSGRFGVAFADELDPSQLPTGE